MKNGHTHFSAVEYSKELRAAGFTQEQAELQARQWELMRGEIVENLATKEDVKGLDLRIATVESKIGETEKEIIKYMGNQNLKIIGVLGGLIAILKFLPDFFN